MYKRQPAWLTDGMSIGGGMVVAVGYAMVINMIATKEVWPFFAIGFCLAAISDLTPVSYTHLDVYKRQVMHMLEINGLLECRQGSGNYLRCEPQDYMVKFMNMVMSLQQIKYTEVYDIRMGYETVALRLAIKNATEEEIEEMHQILIKMDEIENPKESGKLDMQFHNKLIEASHLSLIHI